MKEKITKPLSAQVILLSESGKQMDTKVPITSENVHEYLPKSETRHLTQNYFADLGFDVQEGFGNSFAIIGSKKLFQNVFDTKIVKTKGNNVKAKLNDETKTGKLPINNLAKEIRRKIAEIIFTELPDFGPTNF